MASLNFFFTFNTWNEYKINKNKINIKIQVRYKKKVDLNLILSNYK